MANRVVEKERFVVVDPSGRRHTVVVLLTLIDAGTMGHPSWIDGLRDYRLTDGRPINVGADGSLVLVESGEILRRV
jgi:hypothetical protein